MFIVSDQTAVSYFQDICIIILYIILKI